VPSVPAEGKRSFSDIDERACTQCGACVSICPIGVIATDGHEVRLHGECISCGLCYDFCPGREMDFGSLSEAHLHAVPSDALLGHYRHIGVAYATSEEIRQRAASGGVVTALLNYLLETDQIGGAIGVTMRDDKPWECQPAVLRTPQEVNQAAQSKYSVLGVDAVLRTARNEDGPFAFVGLPCHVHGLRRLQRIASYRAKFPIVIGLFCGFNLAPTATEHLIDKAGLTRRQVTRLEYRGGPWPGGLLIHGRDGQRHFVPKHEYSYVNFTYLPRRCLACPDLTSELADLSVGDCWLEEYAGGWSTVISRSAQGEQVLTQAAEAGVLRTETVGRESILRSHGHLLAYKKEGYFVRQSWLRVPLEYRLLRPPISALRWIQQSLLLATILILSTPAVRGLVQRLPSSWLSRLSRAGRAAAMGATGD
jgi:coenzyme F420 hydrogenase subunit beta